ncbi:hypothetical protein MVEN_00083700 [Mycena venus]|uniref:Uncharacterized protein n=1 Tax=Mycena venus TaxID=2733690 RepID=A0A8H6Z7E1_9AGAR|nr:hypothetical protein MVEN_00083700 [Mycena venus]
MSHPRPTPCTPLPGLRSNMPIHTAPDSSQWVNIGDQWVPHDAQLNLQLMEVDSPVSSQNPYPLTQPPVHEQRNQEQFHFSFRPASTSAGLSIRPSSSHVPNTVIDPHLLPLPNNCDDDDLRGINIAGQIIVPSIVKSRWRTSSKAWRAPLF